MDAVEVARRAAGALHDAAVARGDDPWDSLKLALGEAERRSISAFPVPPGDPALKGGLALFDRQGRFILYADTGSNFDRAFLIAHEIGHVELEGLNGRQRHPDRRPRARRRRFRKRTRPRRRLQPT